MDQLKDVILSTLAEIQENAPVDTESGDKKEERSQTKETAKEKKELPPKKSQETPKKEESFFEQVTSAQGQLRSDEQTRENELLFLNSLRERFLVLFEGFQAPNNTSVEAKLDLTLNFLEYVLSVIDNRIEKIKGK